MSLDIHSSVPKLNKISFHCKKFRLFLISFFIHVSCAFNDKAQHMYKNGVHHRNLIKFSLTRDMFIRVLKDSCCDATNFSEPKYQETQNRKQTTGIHFHTHNGKISNDVDIKNKTGDRSTK